MKRIIPYPLLASTLFIMWILLTGFSPGHILLGGLISVSVSRIMIFLQPEQPNIKISFTMIKLLFLCLADIFRSNMSAARVIITGKKDRRSGFINLPIRIRSSYALSCLSMMCTATPGTLWVQYDPSCHMILIHFLDMEEAEHWVKYYEEIYEPMLMEIFE